MGLPLTTHPVDHDFGPTCHCCTKSFIIVVINKLEEVIQTSASCKARKKDRRKELIHISFGNKGSSNEHNRHQALRSSSPLVASFHKPVSIGRCILLGVGIPFPLLFSLFYHSVTFFFNSYIPVYFSYFSYHETNPLL